MRRRRRRRLQQMVVGSRQEHAAALYCPRTGSIASPTRVTLSEGDAAIFRRHRCGEAPEDASDAVAAAMPAHRHRHVSALKCQH